MERICKCGKGYVSSWDGKCGHCRTKKEQKVHEEKLLFLSQFKVTIGNKYHGAGAAKDAYKHHGARFGKSYGHYGDSFAIPTKDEDLAVHSLDHIHKYVLGFLAYAKDHRKEVFIVTRIGCGLAGYKDEQIAPLFKNAPLNCHFDEAWKPYLGDSYTYWGTK